MIYNVAMRMITCAYCSKEFPYDGTHAHKKFCSLKCVASAPRPKRRLGKYLTCPICNKKFYRQPSRIRGKVSYCSRECMAKGFSHTRQGENNPRWRGGGRDYIWYGQTWRRQSAIARQRDKYTCQHCHKTEAELGYKLRVHHIKPFSSFNLAKRANRLVNLISLCESCHRAIENSSSVRNEPRFIALPFPSQQKPILQPLNHP